MNFRSPTKEALPWPDLGSFYDYNIVVPKRGGLGNQLFQYAAALRGAAETGGSVFWVPSDNPLRRPDIQLEDLVGPQPRATAAQMASFLWPPPDMSCWLSQWNRRGRRKLNLGRVVWRIPDGIMEQIELSFWGRTLLFDAFFQDPAYYEPMLQEVVDRILSRRPVPTDTASDELAVSFRVGADFREMGWCLPWEFYENAASSLDPQRQCIIRVICDEPAAVAEYNNRFHNCGWSIAHSPANSRHKAINDFWHLAHAGRLVLSCSTFAWWAAVVNEKLYSGTPGRIVAPDPWQPVYRNRLVRSSWRTLHSGG